MRRILLTVSAILLFALLCGMSIAAVRETARANEMSLRYENSLKASLSAAIEDMRSLEGDLSKLMITSERQTEMLSAVALKSAGCANALARLPVVAKSAQNVLKFANQLSAYCTLNVKKDTLPQDFEEQIYSFFTTCQSVNGQLAQLENQIQAGELSLLSTEKDEQESSGMFGSVTDDIMEYPSVIFDGPFSDGQEKTTPKRAREEVTAEDAAVFLQHMNFAAEYSGEIEGVVPCYKFESENFQAQITKKGGLLLMLIYSREIGEATLSLKEGEEKAQAFAQKLGYGEVKEVWREFYGNTAVYNFAPVKDGVTLYPDLFKIKIALDTGDVISFEGKSYVMNEHEREISAPHLSQTQAAEKLKDGFEIGTVRLCIVSSDQKEYLSWEFFGEYKDMRYAVYFDANSGREITSFRIINSESGEMVI